MIRLLALTSVLRAQVIGDGGEGVSTGRTGVIPGEIVDRLRCPECGEPVKDARGEPGVECGNGHRFAVRDGYLDCSTGSVPAGSTDRTFASFGFEWNSFDDVRDCLLYTSPSPRDS